MTEELDSHARRGQTVIEKEVEKLGNFKISTYRQVDSLLESSILKPYHLSPELQSLPFNHSSELTQSNEFESHGIKRQAVSNEVTPLLIFPSNKGSNFLLCVKGLQEKSLRSCFANLTVLKNNHVRDVEEFTENTCKSLESGSD